MPSKNYFNPPNAPNKSVKVDPYGNYHYDIGDYDTYDYERDRNYEEYVYVAEIRRRAEEHVAHLRKEYLPAVPLETTAATTVVLEKLHGSNHQIQVTEEKKAMKTEVVKDPSLDPFSSVNVKRSRLADKIIGLFKPNGYVFGGYLRDEIAQTPFTDIDMYFPINNLGYDYIGILSIVSALKKVGLTVTDLGEVLTYVGNPEADNLTKEGRRKNKHRSKSTLRVRKLEVEDKMTGAVVRFDVVTNICADVNDDHPFVAGLDADVNALWRDQNGNLRVAGNLSNKVTLEEIKKNIIAKVFTPMGEMKEERIDKLTAKGYRAVTTPKVKVSKKVAEKVSDKKESKIMSKSDTTFGEQLKDEMIQGAYQAAGAELAAGVKEGLLAAARAYGADDGAVAALTKFLDTPAGQAAIESALGHALPYAPMIGENEHVEAVAKQMRIHGYAQGMRILFGVMMQFILPNISKTFEKLDAQIAAANGMSKTLGKSKVRVAKDADAEEEAEAEEEAVVPARKSKTA